ncbi:MAG: metal ABC transporter ATP-binding protein, partial [Caldilineaceae bacterium]
VELSNVTFGYGATPVLEEVSLHLHPGQFAALVGPSGAGKTSLLKLLLGTLRASEGRVLIHGELVNGRPSPHVGYVPQLETVDWNFPVTVEQVVLMGRTRRSGIWPWPSRSDRALAKQVLEQLGIGEFARRHIRDLSGGQQQRVFLARALVAEPDLLVLDEPTSGLDMRTAESILHLLAHLNQEGMTILMTTHDLNAAAAHLPWVVCLNRRVIAEGPPDLVFDEATLQKTYEGEFVVIRKEGMLFVQQKPHGHTWQEILPVPVLGHIPPDAATNGARTGKEASDGVAPRTLSV